MRHSSNGVAAGSMRLQDMWWSPPRSVQPRRMPVTVPCCGYAHGPDLLDQSDTETPYLSAGQVSLTRALTELNYSLDFPEPSHIPNHIPMYSDFSARRVPQVSLGNPSCGSFSMIAQHGARHQSSPTGSRPIVCDSSRPCDVKSPAKRSCKNQLLESQRPAKRLAMSVTRESNTCGSVNRAAQIARAKPFSEASPHKVIPATSPVSSSTRIFLNGSIASCHVSPSATTPSLPSSLPPTFPLENETGPPTFRPFEPKNCRTPSFKHCQAIPPFTECFDLEPKSIQRPWMDGNVYLPLYEKLTCPVQRKLTKMTESVEENGLDLDLHL